MHTIEHIGLGRYGDTLSPNGDLRATMNVKEFINKWTFYLLSQWEKGKNSV